MYNRIHKCSPRNESNDRLISSQKWFYIFTDGRLGKQKVESENKSTLVFTEFKFRFAQFASMVVHNNEERTKSRKIIFLLVVF